jgi:hypothetical protein
MPRLRGILLTAAAHASTLCCLALVTLWARSYGVEEQIRRDRPHTFALASGHGELVLTYADRTHVRPVRVFRGWTYSASPAFRRPPARDYRNVFGVARHFDLGGFSFVHGRKPTTSYVGPAIADPVLLRLGVPHWLFAVACAILPIRSFVYRRPPPATPLTQCRTCGYDLRATPERCPECGRIPT